MVARLHDGSQLEIAVSGDGPAVLLPVNPTPIEGPRAEELRAWGADPALGRNLVDGLADAFRVVAFDYEGHVLANPKPDTLTPDSVVDDILAVADAAGADRFAWYGYSWFGMIGLQLAIRTDRLTALAIGGYPPIDGPYAEMLAVTSATHEAAVAQAQAPPATVTPEAAVEPGDWSSAQVTLSPAQTGQFVTLYRPLGGFDDRSVQNRIAVPRLALAGSADEIDYDQPWGGVHVSIGQALARGQAELEALGWEVHVLDGLDHMSAMQARTVLPILRPWLERALQGSGG